jgi:NADH:ubiquinone oxidoreductase subunit 6 (subunit J)
VLCALCFVLCAVCFVLCGVCCVLCAVGAVFRCIIYMNYCLRKHFQLSETNCENYFSAAAWSSLLFMGYTENTTTGSSMINVTVHCDCEK